MFQEKELNVQVVGNNPKSFPANNFFILENGDDIICYFIYDDMSSDPATCIPISISKNYLSNFIKSSENILKSIEPKKSKFIPWDNRKSIGREMSPFRVSVIQTLALNDVIHLSLGYLHPILFNQTIPENGLIQIPSLVEISYVDTHFLKLYNRFKEILSAEEE